MSRRQGAAMGLAVGGAITAAALVLNGSGRGDPVETVVTFGGPVIGTGVLSGFVFGRRAARPQSWNQRAKDGLAMAFFATAVGDFLVAFGMGLTRAVSDPDLPSRIVAALQGAVVLGVLGFLLFGLIAVPITWAAAFAWQVGMERFAVDRG